MSDADLADLMRRAAQHQMTPAERQEQTISLVCGLLPEDSPLTKDDVAKMIYARDGNLAEMEARIAELEADSARLREFVRVWEENLGKLLSDAPLPGPAFHPPIPVRNCPRCSLPWDRAVGYVCTDPYCPRGGPAYATGDAR